MKKNDLLQEIQFFTRGKTFDALIPPLIFGATNQLAQLNTAILAAILVATFNVFYRIIRGDKKVYALGGLLAVIAAGGYSWFTQDPRSYFLATFISSGILAIGSVLLLFFNKPLALLLSHLSRGWPIKWYFRKDIFPAYFEVSIIWSLLLLLRLAVRYFIYTQQTALIIAISNLLLGWPLNVGVLVLSYIYGIWRLRRLKGPSVEEFIQNKPSPWKGQTKGF